MTKTVYVLLDAKAMPDDGSSYVAVVEFDSARLKMWARRMERVKSLRAEGDDVYGIEYWNYDATFFAWGVLKEEVSEDWDGTTPTIHAELPVHAGEEAETVDGQTAIVTEDDVTFEALWKHGPGSIRADPVTEDLLRQVAEALGEAGP